MKLNGYIYHKSHCQKMHDLRNLEHLRFARSGWRRSEALRSVLNIEGHMTKNHPRMCYIMFLTLLNFVSDSQTHTVCC